MSLEIRYTPSEGVTLHGTTKPDAPKLKLADRWRWYNKGGFWYIQRTRDRVISKFLVEAYAERLKAQGFEVTVSYDPSEAVRPAAEREADAIERGEARIERLEDRADKHAAESSAAHAAVHRIADNIPPGQPILVGHHSERRHRRDLDKIDRGMRKAIDASDAAADARGAAHATARRLEDLKDAGMIMRRIDRLEADRRGLERSIVENKAKSEELKAVSTRKVTGGQLVDGSATGSFTPQYWDVLECGHRVYSVGDEKTPCATERQCGECLITKSSLPISRFEQWGEEAKARLAAAVDEIGHLRSKLPKDLPGPTKFQKDDLIVCQWGNGRVLRVNKTCLTVRLDEAPGNCEAFRICKIPYNKGPRLMGARPAEPSQAAPDVVAPSPQAGVSPAGS